MEYSAARAKRLSLKSSALANRLDPSCIWSVFLSYNIARAVFWSYRLSWIWFREMRELKALKEEERKLLEDNEEWEDDIEGEKA